MRQNETHQSRLPRQAEAQENEGQREVCVHYPIYPDEEGSEEMSKLDEFLSLENWHRDKMTWRGEGYPYDKATEARIELFALRARNKELLEMLKECYAALRDAGTHCPECGKLFGTNAPNCRLAQLLKEEEK